MRQLCNVVYALLVENKDAKERAEFDSDLYAPPNWDRRKLLG